MFTISLNPHNSPVKLVLLAVVVVFTFYGIGYLTPELPFVTHPERDRGEKHKSVTLRLIYITVPM